MNELCAGKHLGQQADSSRVGWRLQHDRLVGAHCNSSQKPSQFRLPARQVFRRNSLHVEKRIAEGVIRERHPLIGRTDTEIAKREFVFLRMFEAGRHVVHRPPGGKEEFEITCDDPRGHQRMHRSQALVCRRKSELLVSHQQLVQQRGADCAQ